VRVSGIVRRVVEVARMEGLSGVLRRILGATWTGLLPWALLARVVVVAGKVDV